MHTILDTADLDEIRKWQTILNGKVSCVTTNPHLLKDVKIDSEEKMRNFVFELEKIIPNPNVFFQCFTKEDVEKISNMRDSFETKTNVNYIVKITMHPKYFNLVEVAHDHDLETAATTCYDLVQIHQAAEFGMNYSLVYVAKNDDENILTDAVKLKRDYNYDITLIAGSFRTKKDYVLALKSGIDSATVSPKVLEVVYNNENTIRDVLKIYEMPDPLSTISE